MDLSHLLRRLLQLGAVVLVWLIIVVVWSEHVRIH
jgi:hypothetical protein